MKKGVSSPDEFSQNPIPMRDLRDGFLRAIGENLSGSGLKGLYLPVAGVEKKHQIV